MMLAWKLKSKNKSLVYARTMEDGVLIGLGSLVTRELQAMSATETILTHTDRSNLGHHRTKERRDDIINLLKQFNQLCEDASGDSPDFFGHIAFVNKEGQVSQIVRGEQMQSLRLSDFIEQVLKEPKHIPDESICEAIVRLQTSAPVRFRDQMYLLNLLPVFHAVTCEERTSRGVPMHVVWQRLGARSLVLQEHCDIRAIEDTFAKLHEGVPEGWVSRKPRAIVLQRKGAPRKQQTSKRRKIQCLLQQSSDCLQFMPVIPILSAFRNELERHGCIRVLRQSDTQLDIIWNSFDVETGMALFNLRDFVQSFN